MDNEEQLINLIESVSADRTLTQPWKNYALSDMRRSLALLKMASGTIYVPAKQTPHTALETADCICPMPGVLNQDCKAKVHKG